MFIRSIAILFFFLSVRLFGHETFLGGLKVAGDLCRVRVNPSEILVREDGMYHVCKNRHLIPISGLQFEAGSYTATVPRGGIEDVFGVWWCYNCQNWNSKFDHSCQYCGCPR